jgi:hypothetical protein
LAHNADGVHAGFWAGLTLGRLVLPSLNVWIGEWRAIAGLVVLTLIFEAVIWVARSFVGAAVLYAITGFLLGPMYPSAISLSTKLLPKSLHVRSLGLRSCTELIETADWRHRLPRRARSVRLGRLPVYRRRPGTEAWRHRPAARPHRPPRRHARHLVRRPPAGAQRLKEGDSGELYMQTS